MADSEWSYAIMGLLTSVICLVIFKNVLIPQIKGLFTEIKPAITKFTETFKKKEEE
jgi:type II secretory pathway component PulF